MTDVLASEAVMLPTLAEIHEAAALVAGHVVQTPLLTDPGLNDRLGGQVWFKAEVLQRTGSFKYRGAFHFLSRMAPDARVRGVIAFSSGNHAQAVAAAARYFGVPAVIVMPEDAPVIKIENTRGYGAEVVLYNRLTESREAIARDIGEARGLTLLPPYDHRWTMAGQGTVGLEICDQLAAAGAGAPDMVLVPCSGGGLTAGVAMAVHERFPAAQVYAVEPEGYGDTTESLAAGRRIQVPDQPPSLCDSLLMTTPGELTFAVNQRESVAGVVVAEADILAAVRHLFMWQKLVAEPGGAVGLAALLAGQVPVAGKTAVVILSGGNVDSALYAEILGGR